jgi:pyruvate/2-oxoglutarate dehydrogenase complex dihydrolipoamide acyltransferase (E2) component
MKLKLLCWLIAEGALVKPGDILCEIECGNAWQELEADQRGILRRLKQTGDVFASDEMVCRIEPVAP